MNIRHESTLARILVLGSVLALPGLAAAQDSSANSNPNGQSAPAAAPAATPAPAPAAAPAAAPAPAPAAMPAPAPAAAPAASPAATPAPAQGGLMHDIKKDVEHADRDVKNALDPDRVRHYTGTVKSVDAAAHTLVLVSSKGKTRTFPLPAEVKVMKGKTAAALSDVAAGAKVRVSYRLKKDATEVQGLELK